MTVGGEKILMELEGLPGGRPSAEAPEKPCRRNKNIIADRYCMSRITCKYLSCSEMETSRLSPSSPQDAHPYPDAQHKRE